LPSEAGHKSPAPEEESRAEADSELSFEQRFPSVEALDGVEAAKPKPPQSATISAGGRRRPSLVIANLTGGDLAPNIRSPKVPLQQLPPQPRSTQVTGTAFKTDARRVPEEPAASASSATADYLSLMDDDDQPHPQVMDLMDDEESESMKVALAPLRPAISKTPSSGSRFGVSPSSAQPSLQQQQKMPSYAPKPEPGTPGKQGAAQRATLPPISAERPTTNINSEQWSPLERMRTASSKSPTSPTRGGTQRDLLDDSSDDEAAPENANGPGHRPISPLRRAPPSPDIARRMSSFEPLATRTSASPPQSSSGFQDSTHRNSASPGGSRPQSMFISPSPSQLSPGVGITGLPSDDSGHQRRGSGSINDIVSRYEAMGRRPPVAAKPASLTGSYTGGAGAAPGIKPPAVPPSVPTKPAMLRKPSGGRPMPGAKVTPGTAANTQQPLRRASSINVASKPAPAPKPAALQAHGKSDSDKSGSGGAPGASASARSQGTTALPVPAPHIPASSNSSMRFPEPQPQSQPQQQQQQPPLQRPLPVRAQSHSASASTSRSNSPEKQQPVNVLIARWNKGQV